MDSKSLQQIGKLLENNTSLLRKEIKESENRIKAELKEKIAKSQEETIEAVTDLMNTGFNLHEKRIKRIEDHLDLSQIQ